MDALYRGIAFASLVLHLLWLVWVLLGWVVTRGRPVLRGLHILSLGWGMLVSVFPWTCPLTYAETSFQMRAGLDGYDKSFLEHYVELLVYPDVPPRALMIGAVSVCVAILCVHLQRYRRRTSPRW